MSIIWATIAASLGILMYLAVPILIGLGPEAWRQSVMDFHYGLAMKCFGQLAIVRRSMGGYDLLPFSVDDEQEVAEVTLESGLVSDDKTLPFKDPDDRIKRLHKKPLAVVPEGVPAAVDAELCEVAHWTHKHDLDDGFQRHEQCGTCGGAGVVGEGNACTGCSGTGHKTVVDPYIEIPDSLTFIDPMAAAPFVTKSVEPSWLSTVKSLTRKRFEKYGGDVGAIEVMATFTAFAMGLGGVMAMQYLNNKILAGGGGEVNTSTVPIIADGVTDLVVTML